MSIFQLFVELGVSHASTREIRALLRDFSELLFTAIFQKLGGSCFINFFEKSLEKPLDFSKFSEHRLSKALNLYIDSGLTTNPGPVDRALQKCSLELYLSDFRGKFTEVRF